MKLLMQFFRNVRLTRTTYPRHFFQIPAFIFSLLVFVVAGCSKGDSNNNNNSGNNGNGSQGGGGTQSDGLWHQQGNKLIGTGAAGAAGQGHSIALSGDGNTAFWEGSQDNNSAGAAWAFIRSGTAWTQQSSKLVASGVTSNSLHLSASISADGNTAVIGTPYYNNTKGAVRVFTRTGGAWAEQATLEATNTFGDALGIRVAISADGNTIVAGQDNPFSEGAFVFTRTNGSWTQQGGRLVGTGEKGVARQGTAIAVSADGNTFVMGGWADSLNVGAAWVFTRNGTSWSQQGIKLVGSDGTFSPNLGLSVAISSDGNTVAVGGPSDDIGIGATWIYTRTSGVWSQAGNKLVGSDAIGRAYQGAAVALSGDGNTLAVGGFRDNNNAGAVWMFTRSGNTWTQKQKVIPTAGVVGSATFGIGVALNADGTTMAAGGSSDDNQKGAAWIFTR